MLLRNSEATTRATAVSPSKERTSILATAAASAPSTGVAVGRGSARASPTPSGPSSSPGTTSPFTPSARVAPHPTRSRPPRSWPRPFVPAARQASCRPDGPRPGETGSSPTGAPGPARTCQECGSATPIPRGTSRRGQRRSSWSTWAVGGAAGPTTGVTPIRIHAVSAGSSRPTIPPTNSPTATSCAPPVRIITSRSEPTKSGLWRARGAGQHGPRARSERHRDRDRSRPRPARRLSSCPHLPGPARADARSRDPWVPARSCPDFVAISVCLETSLRIRARMAPYATTHTTSQMSASSARSP